MKTPLLATDAPHGSLRGMVLDSGEDGAENRLKKTFFIVEATSYEQFVLWQDWCAQSESPRYGKLKWEQVNPGWLVTVGKIGKRPCCISVSWNRIEGRLVMFWYQCSQVTDSLQAEAWLEEHFKGKYDNGHRRASTDAQNFGHCIHAIQDANRIHNDELSSGRPA